MLHRRAEREPVDRVLHALADPNRRAIVDRLSVGPATVSELAQPLPMSLSAVVQHIEVLQVSGVVRSEKVGRVRTCQIEPAALRPLEQWIAARRSSWERRLDRLGRPRSGHAMSGRSVDHATFVAEREYEASPERAFAAWADPEVKARWFVDSEANLELDFRVGGREHHSGTAPN